ncbi:MAG TPA: helix-turn-helix domain-containing protein [Ilumatobacteraceae bacterium]|nr:helix-turn-helix domain-containing protein [Ilumatobacteraceae bacterium]
MRDYGQYCPVSLGSEVLADRWTPLILRELVLGSTRFNDIERGMPGISRTLLAQRLRHLELRGVLRRIPLPSGRGHEYHLTDAGRDLEPVIMAIGEWAVRWLFAEPLPAEVDPITLTWWLHRRVDTTQLPTQRVVVEFDYTGADATTLWLVLDQGEPSVCVKDPGLDVDLVVVTDPVSMMRVFSGITTLVEAVADDKIQIFGPSKLTRAFGGWFLWSPFVNAVQTAIRNDKRAAVAARRN